ncbi:MAG: fumarylacetoacetate hydrolase family protein [Oscillospiraceae bacterium]|jgi:2-keto-4-pentenoate hydratase/2-oxohepta-3-ene-1,7-dioic acid hydratase in catechol pathway|nr:fumarylacetoacetate hydrolase family protein [Oscillospiraceae bacterium]
MKFCGFVQNGEIHIGISAEKGVLDITALGFPGSMNEVIAGGAAMTAKIAQVAAAYGGAYLRESELTFANVTRPEKIVCEGLNYKAHAAETGGEPPQYPVLFSKFNDTLAPAGQPVALPSQLRRFDYEAELVIVVGAPAYNIAEEDAEGYIFGYTCGNDLSARDSQFLSSQWLSGKSFPGFAPAGPYIVTRDSFDPDVGAGIFCEVNGERVQSGNTSDMIFNCRATLAAASRYFPLAPGDLIFTGTPAGVILGRPKGARVWLKPGDVVKVIIDGVGELVTPLIG